MVTPLVTVHTRTGDSLIQMPDGTLHTLTPAVAQQFGAEVFKAGCQGEVVKMVREKTT